MFAITHTHFADDLIFGIENMAINIRAIICKIANAVSINIHIQNTHI